MRSGPRRPFEIAFADPAAEPAPLPGSHPAAVAAGQETLVVKRTGPDRRPSGMETPCGGGNGGSKPSYQMQMPFWAMGDVKSSEWHGNKWKGPSSPDERVINIRLISRLYKNACRGFEIACHLQKESIEKKIQSPHSLVR